MKKIKERRLLDFITLGVILMGGFLVRLYKIDNPVADWHSWRQADTASVTRVYLQEGLNLLYPKYHDVSSIQTGLTNLEGYRMVEFPLFNFFHYLFFNLLPQISFEIWGRLVSIFSSLISAFFLFLLGKRFIGKSGGLLSAFFYLFIPYNVYFTRVILPEPLSVSLGVAAVWFFVVYIDKEKLSSLFASGFLFALSILVKPYSVFYAIPLVLLVFNKYKNIQGIVKGKWPLIYLDIVLVPFFLWRAWINQFPQGIPHFTWVFNGDHIRFRPAFWRWIFGERIGILILGASGVALFVEGLVKSKNFLKLFFLGNIIYLTIIATANVRHDYYQIFIIPAIALILAQGFLSYWENKKSYLSKFIAVFLVFIMFIVGLDRIKEFYKINHPEIIEAGKVLDRLAPKSSKIIAPYNGDTAFLYQTKRWGWPVVDSSIPELIEKGAEFLVSVNFDKDTKEAMKIYKVIEKTDRYVIVDLRMKEGL